MILEQMVDVLVEFIERVHALYCSGQLTLRDYTDLTTNKIHFLENHLHEIKVMPLKSRCELILALNKCKSDSMASFVLH